MRCRTLSKNLRPEDLKEVFMSANTPSSTNHCRAFRRKSRMLRSSFAICHSLQIFWVEFCLEKANATFTTLIQRLISDMGCFITSTVPLMPVSYTEGPGRTRQKAIFDSHPLALYLSTRVQMTVELPNGESNYETEISLIREFLQCGARPN